MADEKDTNKFKVVDRRMFTDDGDLRDDAPAAAPVAEDERPALKLVKDEPPKPEAVAAEAAEQSGLGPVPVPDAAEPVTAETPFVGSPADHDVAAMAYNAQAENSPFAAQKVEFLHLLELLVQSAMMYAGAMENGPERRVDIVGLRQMIDMIGVLQDKTKGNLTDAESKTLSNTLFQLRMSYMEIVNAIQSQVKPGGPQA